MIQRRIAALAQVGRSPSSLQKDARGGVKDTQASNSTPSIAGLL